MAPGVGSTEMRYCGISLFRMADNTTRALWPEVPTGGVPHLMSLGCACDQADEFTALNAKTTANAVSARLSMAFPLWFFCSLTGRADDPLRPAVDAYGAYFDDEIEQRASNDPPIATPWQRTKRRTIAQ